MIPKKLQEKIDNRISFNVARHLRYIGYNVPCQVSVVAEDNIPIWSPSPKDLNKLKGIWYSAPTYEEVYEWFEKEWAMSISTVVKDEVIYSKAHLTPEEIVIKTYPLPEDWVTSKDLFEVIQKAQEEFLLEILHIIIATGTWDQIETS